MFTKIQNLAYIFFMIQITKSAEIEIEIHKKVRQYGDVLRAARRRKRRRRRRRRRWKEGSCWSYAQTMVE